MLGHLRLLLAFSIAISASACTTRELHAVSVYGGFPIGPNVTERTGPLEMPPQQVDVSVDRPGSVVLLLSSYEQVLWNVETSHNTRIERIVLWGGNPTSHVLLNGSSTESFEWTKQETGFLDDGEGSNFRLLVDRASDLYRFDGLDSFHGQHEATPSGFQVKTRETDKDYLRPDYLVKHVVPAERLPDIKFAATLDRVSALYDLRGNTVGQADYNKATVFVPAFGASFTFNKEGFSKRAGAKVTQINAPSGLPKISTVEAAAYDAKRKLVLGVGFSFDQATSYLFSYDPANDTWLAQNLKTRIASLAYDKSRDLYIGTTTHFTLDPIQTFDPKNPTSWIVRPSSTLPQSVESSRWAPLNQRFPGWADLNHRDLIIHAIEGNNMVLVAQALYPNGHGYSFGYRVYLYNLANDAASLTGFRDYDHDPQSRSSR